MTSSIAQPQLFSLDPRTIYSPSAGQALTRAPRFRITFPEAKVSGGGSCTWQALDQLGLARVVGYRLDDEAFVQGLQNPLPDHLADLLDVALALYLADRLSLRPHSTSFRWARDLELTIPVRNPDRWNEEHSRKGLEGLLRRLTGDLWHLGFCERRGDPRSLDLQPPLFPWDGRLLEICLFSGGLDSAAGVVNCLLRSGHKSVIGVGGTTSTWLAHTQRILMRAIAGRFPGRVGHLSVSFGLAGIDEGNWPLESGQRTRGFVHLVLGFVTAVLVGEDSLAVHENGVGALNLPMVPAQYGARMSQAMNPMYLADASLWLSHFLGRPFQVRAPALNQTKGEACAGIVEAGLNGLVQSTISCDGFQRVAGKPQCGKCTSCLHRRHGVFFAGLDLEDSANRYRFDITSPDRLAHPTDLVPLRLMLHQVGVFRDRMGGAENSWSELTSEFPTLLEIATRREEWRALGGMEEPEETIPRLLERYTAQWSRFPIDPVLMARASYSGRNADAA